MRFTRSLIILILLIFTITLCGCEEGEKVPEEYTITINKGCEEIPDLKYVNYAFFPKYIRKSTYNLLLEQNEKLASEGAKDIDGNPIFNIMKTTQGGNTYHSKLFLTGNFYDHIDVSNKYNLFGEEYYAYSGQIVKMSILQIKLGYVLYTQCGFTLEMLYKENEYFSKLIEEKELDISFDNVIGGGVSYSLTVKPGEELNLPTPKRYGYQFDGWYIGENKLTSSNIIVDKNMEINEKWNIIEYQITYHLDGGINSANNPSTFNIEDESFILEEPTKEGFKFIGWARSLSDNPIAEYQINTTIIRDVEVYAIFEPIS